MYYTHGSCGESRIIVMGPSFAMSTSMSAAKTPDCTFFGSYAFFTISTKDS